MFRRGRIRRHCVCASLIAVASVIHRPVLAEDTNVIARFRIAKNGGGILVPVNVDGKEYMFMLDTGTTLTAFDSILLTDKATGKVTLRGTGRDTSVQLFDVPTATIGQRNLHDDLARAHDTGGPWTFPLERGTSADSFPGVFRFDFSRIREVSGLEIYGIIGMDYLRNWVVQISFDGGELLFLKTATVTDQANSFDLSNDGNGIPMVRCQISDWGETDLLLDTGLNGSGELNRQTAQLLSQLGHAEVVGKYKTATLSGEQESHYLLLKSFALGGHQSNKLLFGEGYANRLGLGYMSRYDVTFDFPRNKLYVREGKAFNKPESEMNLSGMHLIRKNSRTVVDSIDADSAAEKSGIMAGDFILKVDKLDASTTSLHDIWQVLCQKNPAARVIAERAGKQIEVTIELK